MSEFKSLVDTVITENRKVLDQVNEAEIEQLVDAIGSAKQIQLFGVGRMKASTRAFAMRLMHMGFTTHVVYDTTTPRIGSGDLLIVNCGITAIGLNAIKKAKEAGATVCVITAYPENEHARLADFRVHLPGQIFGTEQEVSSIQPMAALMEQALFLFEDILVLMLMARFHISPETMAHRHTNLEGIDTEFA